jgi:hypothetical protein
MSPLELRKIQRWSAWLSQKIKLCPGNFFQSNQKHSEAYNEVLEDMRDEELFGKAAAQIQNFENSGYQE